MNGDVRDEERRRAEGQEVDMSDQRLHEAEMTSDAWPAEGRVDDVEHTGHHVDDGLLAGDDRGSYQKRWDDIQVRFIDEPRESVRQADDLVSEVTTRISERFSNARQDMERRWDGGDAPTTEELRQAVRRYRDFFQRLVAQ